MQSGGWSLLRQCAMGFLGNSTVSSTSPKPLESPRVFAVVHFSHYFTSQLNKRKRYSAGHLKFISDTENFK